MPANPRRQPRRRAKATPKPLWGVYIFGQLACWVGRAHVYETRKQARSASNCALGAVGGSVRRVYLSRSSVSTTPPRPAPAARREGAAR